MSFSASPATLLPFEALVAASAEAARSYPERQAAGEALERLGLPGLRDEDWRWTPLAALKKESFVAAASAPAFGVDSLPRPWTDESCRLVFVAGFFRPELSDLEGLPEGAALVQAPREVWETEAADLGAFALLAGAAAEPEARLRLEFAAGAKLAKPIEILQLNGHPELPLAQAVALDIAVGAGAEATLLQRQTTLPGAPASFQSLACRVTLAEEARLTHLLLSDEGAKAWRFEGLAVDVAASAAYRRFSFATGAAMQRTDANVVLAGDGAETVFNAGYLLAGKSHWDLRSRIDHKAVGTTCREVVKGAIDDAARGVFQGKLIVHPGAQQTDGHQLSRALLLSDKAEVDAKPELEIYADDVKCSHGATAGDLDPQALFYLRARGIAERRARALLIESFLMEAFELLEDEALLAPFREAVTAWLGAHAEAAP